MAMLHERPEAVEAAVARAASAVADADAELARARRELSLACAAYAARLAGEERLAAPRPRVSAGSG